MPTYKENREKIRNKLYEINATVDRDEAYKKMVDYVLTVATKSWEEASRRYGYDREDIDGDIEDDFINLGLVPGLDDQINERIKPGREAGKQ